MVASWVIQLGANKLYIPKSLIKRCYKASVWAAINFIRDDMVLLILVMGARAMKMLILSLK